MSSDMTLDMGPDAAEIREIRIGDMRNSVRLAFVRCWGVVQIDMERDEGSLGSAIIAYAKRLDQRIKPVLC